MEQTSAPAVLVGTDAAAPRASVSNALRDADAAWLIGFALATVGFEIGLFLLGGTALRMPLRIGVYGVSLAYLVLIRGRGRAVTPVTLVGATAVILCIGLLNPERSSWMAGVAQVALYLATLAPVVWADRLRVTARTFEQMVLVVWAFYAASAMVGALQVQFPGRFDGATSANYDEQFINAMMIHTADGSMLMRPKGLTDVADGAGNSGVYAIILGVGLLFSTRRKPMKIVVIFSMVVSLYCIVLSHVRTNMVVVALAVLAIGLILQRRRDYARVVLLCTVVAGVIAVGTAASFAVGGNNTLDRWATLVDDDPGTVFYKNRGFFLDQMVRQDIFDYPLGAGSGRWGMMNIYFADPGTSIWAEMMWQALLYDGGVPLIITYALLLAYLVRQCWRTAMRTRDPQLVAWAAVAFAFTVSTIAASFVYPVYIKPAGLQVFLLDVCLFSLAGRLTDEGRTGLAVRPARP